MRSSRPEPITPIPLASTEGSGARTLLVATRYFALERVELAGRERVRLPAVASPQVFTCLVGAGVLESSGGVVAVAVGETVVVPVGAEIDVNAEQLADVVLLRGWVPDLEQEIVAPALQAGASMAVIRQLGLSVTSDRG